MPLMDSPDPHAPKELFRYASIRPPRIIDLQSRAKRVPQIADALGRGEEAAASWARTFLESGRVVDSAAKLRFPYFQYLKRKTLSPTRLPTRDDLVDPNGFANADIRAEATYQEDWEGVLLSVIALRIVDGARSRRAEQAARILDFVETFPNLAQITDPLRYAPAVLTRFEFRKLGQATSDPRDSAPRPPTPAADMKRLASGLALLWQARNRRVQDRKEQFDREFRELSHRAPEPAEVREVMPVVKTKNGQKKAEAKALERRANAERAKAYSLALRTRSAALRDLKRTYEEQRRSDTLEAVLRSDNAGALAHYVPGKSPDDIAAIATHVRDTLAKYDLPWSKFCQAYEQAVSRSDAANPSPPTSTSLVSDGCFAQSPQLVFADTVRILGRADLIRVDETFVKYSPGEISYVENMLAGETRERRVKSAKYFEQGTEQTTDTLREASKESSVSTQQELHTQIDTELRSRFQSDVNASASGSGGGNIGVVSLQGSGNVGASLNLGVDSGLKTTNESKLSREIVDKALERTRERIIEKRITRSYTLDQTYNRHEIKNTIGTPKNRNGVYCFLNREVAITETIYGQRLFLLANISRPGESLLCARLARMQMALDDLGQRPVFDISPEDITPGNYLSLAGRFKAANVSPPPAPVVTLARTYKTDTTNTSSEPAEFNARKIADILVPFFERYKRYLITDNIKIPDGYEVMDVAVTINHGSNGISLPAHLPLTLGGAVMYAAPAMTTYAVYGPFLLPYWMWYIGYLASPVLHYNADSSNVTASIGNESQDSPYYFFQPEFLVPEVFHLLGSIADALPGIMASIQSNADTMFQQLGANAAALPAGVSSAISDSVKDLIDQLSDIFKDIVNAHLPEAWTKVQALAASVSTTQLDQLMGDFFGPLRTFVQNVIDLIDSAVGSAISDFFSFLSEMFENTQTLPFHGSAGFREELPVSFNTVAIKPGVTINLTACLRRTDDALDKWRLETFSNFYQAHLQLLADFETKAFTANGADKLAKPPALLRDEEQAAIKERVLFALNNYHAADGSTYTLARLNLFEHALDWSNMTCRAFNYGPTLDQVRLDKSGAFLGADDRRRAFMTSLWAQVMIPVQANEHLEQQIVGYFDSNSFDFDAGLQNEELVALYRDLVLGREQEVGTTGAPKFAVLPTEFTVLMSDDLDAQLPRNPDFPDQ